MKDSKNKNKQIKCFLVVYIFIFFFAFNLYAQDLEERDPNKSPFSKSLVGEIEKQIYGKYNNESDLEKIVNKIEKNQHEDFKGAIYGIQGEFSIALFFNDLNVEKYFKSLAKAIYITYKQNGVSLIPKIEKSRASRKGIIIKYNKSKIQKFFWPLDSSGGIFLMFPKMGDKTVQSVVLCPRQFVSRNQKKSFKNINWELRNVYARIFAKSDIVVNEINPVFIDAYYKFSDDVKKNSSFVDAIGSMTSAKASYDPPVMGIYEKITNEKINDISLFSMVTGVDLKSGDVEKHAYNKTSHEIRKFKLKEDLDFRYSGVNAPVEKGDCYMLLSAMPSFDMTQD